MTVKSNELKPWNTVVFKNLQRNKITGWVFRFVLNRDLSILLRLHPYSTNSSYIRAVLRAMPRARSRELELLNIFILKGVLYCTVRHPHSIQLSHILSSRYVFGSMHSSECFIRTVISYVNVIIVYKISNGIQMLPTACTSELFSSQCAHFCMINRYSFETWNVNSMSWHWIKFTAVCLKCKNATVFLSLTRFLLALAVCTGARTRDTTCPMRFSSSTKSCRFSQTRFLNHLYSLICPIAHLFHLSFVFASLVLFLYFLYYILSKCLALYRYS